MNSLKRIWRAYLESSGHLEAQETSAKSARTREKWARLRDLNDHAYFMMMFACFEDHVSDLCNRLVADKRNLASWRQRRLWDSVDVDRLHFMRKVALLVDRGSGDYAKVAGLYGTRCDIAHGRFAQVGPMMLSADYREFVRLWKALRP